MSRRFSRPTISNVVVASFQDSSCVRRRLSWCLGHLGSHRSATNSTSSLSDCDFDPHQTNTGCGKSRIWCHCQSTASRRFRVSGGTLMIKAFIRLAVRWAYFSMIASPYYTSRIKPITALVPCTSTSSCRGGGSPRTLLYTLHTITDRPSMNPFGAIATCSPGMGSSVWVCQISLQLIRI